jgi:hypothetical protein
VQACKGLRNIYASAKITLVPIKEMADVLSVESKSVDLSRDTWVRMKLGIYKGDLAKVLAHCRSYILSLYLSSDAHAIIFFRSLKLIMCAKGYK